MSDQQQTSKSVKAGGAQQDLAMYAAIAGRPPKIDPNAGDLLDAPAPRSLAKPWSPIVLSIYLRGIARQGALKLNRPEIAAWIRRQSDSAMKRLLETQQRIASSRNDRAA
jgi:hypothetical protein